MEGRFGLYQLIVDPLQHGIVAAGKGVMFRFFDGVVGVAEVAVDVCDGVADGACDAGL